MMVGGLAPLVLALVMLVVLFVTLLVFLGPPALLVATGVRTGPLSDALFRRRNEHGHRITARFTLEQAWRQSSIEKYFDYGEVDAESCGKTIDKCSA
jgi:hypothetical protein